MSASGFQRTLLTLARTPNHSAADVLAAAIDGISTPVRRGAIAAFARRGDEVSQRRFLEKFPQFTREEVAALGDVSKKFKTTLRTTLADHDVGSTASACHFITLCQAFDEFPALVTAATDPQHPGGDALAATALDLARSLHDEIVDYRRAPAGRDPSFARRWALTALSKAVDRFRDHRRVELLEAFLLITTPGNHSLTHLLTDPTHPGHEQTLALLRTSPSIGAIEVLARLYDDPQTPVSLLEIAAERADAHFRKLFLQNIGDPPSARVLENVQRVKKLILLEHPDDDWYALSAAEQATAVRLVAASRFSRRTKLAIFDELLKHGALAARLAACEALGRIELPEATTRLEQLLGDAEPQVVAMAAKALRQHGHASAVDRLAELLEHEDKQVQNVAKSALRDFTFLRYVGKFDALDDESRIHLGQIVRESDPSAVDELRREITAAALPRKLRGLQMATTMGAVDEVLDLVVKHAKHQDAAVRAEAVQALATATLVEARAAIETARSDSNTLVRNRASESLQGFLERNSQQQGGAE